MPVIVLICWVIVMLLGVYIWLPKNRKCLKCGFQSEHSKFCHYDGTKMIRVKRHFLKCSNCKKEIWQSDEYCSNCGVKNDTPIAIN